MKRVFCLSFLLLMLGHGVSAQLFTEVKPPVPAYPYFEARHISENHLTAFTREKMDTVNGKLLITYALFNFKNEDWEKLSTLKLLGYSSPLLTNNCGVIKTGNRFYACSNYDSAIGLPGKAWLLQHYNNQWSTINIDSLIAVADTLHSVLFGDGYNAVKGDTFYFTVRTIRNMKWRNTIFRHYPGGLDTVQAPQYIPVYGIFNFEGQVYGWYGSGHWLISGNQVTDLKLPVPMRLSYPVNGVTSEHWVMINAFTKIAEGKYLYGANSSPGMYFYENNRWLLLKTDLFPDRPILFDGDYFASISGPGSTGIGFGILTGKKWTKIFDWHAEPGVHNNQLYLVGSFGKLYRYNKTYANVSGYAYEDTNLNCRLDSGERKIRNARIILKPSNVNIITDEDGFYSEFIEPGLITAIKVQPKHYEIVCDSLNNFQFKPAGKYTINIPFKATASVKDLSVSLMSYRGSQARRGSDVYYTLIVQNEGTKNIDSCSVDLIHDKRLGDFKCNYSHTRIDSGTIRIKFFNLHTDTSSSIDFSFLINHLKLVTGQSFELRVKFNSYSDDNAANDECTLYQIVVSGYDPNEKSSNPGTKANNKVKDIRYQICFQNLGTDSVVNIQVVDTLEARVNLSSLEFIGGSHPYTVSVRDRIVTWHFKKIMLPPASVNYKESQGFVNFSLSLDNELDINDSTRNRGFIYFDYEDAVITNYAVSKHKNAVSSVPEFMKSVAPGSLHVYPNPNSGSFFVKLEEDGTHELQLFDMQGKLMKTYVQYGQGELEVAASDLPAGIYFLRSSNALTARVIILE